MKRFRYILFAIVFLFLIFITSQSALSDTIDSLKIKLTTELNDSIKVDLLNQITTEYWLRYTTDRIKLGIEYADSSISLAKKLNYSRGLAKGFLNKAKYYISNQSYDKATLYLLQSLTVYDKINDNNGSADCHLQLAVIAYSLQNYSEAEEHLKKCISDNTIRPGTLKVGHYLLAICLSETGNFQSALLHFNIALANYIQNNDTTGIVQCYTYLGKMYLNAKDVDKAFEMLWKAIEIADPMNERQTVFYRSYAFMSSAYLAANKLDSAIYFGETSLNPNDMLTNREALHTLSEAYSRKGDFKKAFQYLNQLKSQNDSVYSITMVNSTAEQRSRFEYKNQLDAQQAEQEKKDAIAIKELQKQKLVKNGFIAGTALFLLLAGAIFVGFKRTRNAKKKSEELLLNILPAEVAEELKITGTAKAKSFTMVTVMFTDFIGFTKISEKVSAELLVGEIHTCFSAFDHILQKYKIEKIKTIGDAYLCASGLPVSNYTHATDMLYAAIEIRNFMEERKKEKESRGEIPFEIRIGIHTGPVVAGIVGVRKYAYDIWGDTVNLAARMEQNSEPGKINISGTTYELVKDKFRLTYRGKIQAKNKGEVDMYFVEGTE